MPQTRFTTQTFDHEQAAALAADIREHYARQGKAPRVLLRTFGCQMNENDSQKLMGMLSMCGYEPTDDRHAADLILYNTCCVRDHAELRVFGNIGALAKVKQERPELVIGVCGCMMQQPDVAQKLQQRFPFVDMVFGTHAMPRFLEFLHAAVIDHEQVACTDETPTVPEDMPVLRDGGHSAYVTIMYGCNNFCSYCIVPYVRGRERSRRVEDILREVEGFARQGIKEVMLLGQNVNSYGLDTGAQSFASLLRHVCEVDGIERLRFMTSHPKDLSDELIDTIAAHETICNHIHLPVQAGSDRILREMNRKYTRGDYLALSERIRARIPEVELTTDVIVGFPTETDAEFEDTLNLVEQVRFASAYTFMYSPRRGTPAAKLPQIDKQVKKERLQQLNDAQAAICKQINQTYVGKREEVLVEGVDKRDVPVYFGKTGTHKMVYFPANDLSVGDFATVRITSAKDNSLLGELCD